jgi:hypothetical protein
VHKINLKGGVMKEFAMILGFGVGLVTGVALYKYSACTKKIVDESEKIIKNEAKKVMNENKKGDK